MIAAIVRINVDMMLAVIVGRSIISIRMYSDTVDRNIIIGIPITVSTTDSSSDL